MAFEFGDDLFGKFDTISAALEKRLVGWGSAEEGGNAKKGLPEKKKKKLFNPKTWERDGRLVEVALKLRLALGDMVYEDHNTFRDLAVRGAIRVLSWRENGNRFTM